MAKQIVGYCPEYRTYKCECSRCGKINEITKG